MPYSEHPPETSFAGSTSPTRESAKKSEIKFGKNCISRQLSTQFELRFYKTILLEDWCGALTSRRITTSPVLSNTLLQQSIPTRRTLASHVSMWAAIANGDGSYIVLYIIVILALAPLGYFCASWYSGYRLRSRKSEAIYRDLDRLWKVRDSLRYHVEWAKERREGANQIKEMTFELKKIDSDIRILNARLDELSSSAARKRT